MVFGFALGTKKVFTKIHENLAILQSEGFLTDTTLSLDLRRNLAYEVYGPALLAVPMFAKMTNMELKCILVAL